MSESYPYCWITFNDNESDNFFVIRQDETQEYYYKVIYTSDGMMVDLDTNTIEDYYYWAFLMQLIDEDEFEVVLDPVIIALLDDFDEG